MSLVQHDVPLDTSTLDALEPPEPEVPDGADSFPASDPPSTWWGGQNDSPARR